ncbi:hypothetical protein BUALT_Bualt15G0097600 [Buddleja alternifolia]|uniref:ZF-HD dimerization-type domain-containing protein n=1 Tax=Buddleja alternifolia TaxID=168488 RepID=A0AAV6WJ82_9LAMI|nr:hypothetical protein BUALT_Bualt15G0097600 [Buddleja alternifolia]
MVKYRECLKNHAASMGGNATDGCGEFMPSGEEGSIEALTCSACNCHRNFHRKEIEGADINNQRLIMARSSFHNKGFHHHHHHIVPRHHMMMSYNNNMGGSDQSDDVEEGGGGGGVATRPGQMMKKRFRTKFSQEQKEKMFEFAEKVGWKIQKQEESVVQQFCQEVGVKRRVLKVWMHNNKHNLTKKNNNQSMNPLNDQV